MHIILRGLFGSAFAIVLWTAAIFIPTWFLTGSIDWPRGWEFIILLTCLYVVATLWLARTDPGLLMERTSMSGKQPKLDRLATLILTIFLISALLFVPFDVHRLQILPQLPEAQSYWDGYLFLTAASIIFWRTMAANTFAATIVKDQTGREQKVIDKGPYAIIRHPMYLGIALFLVGFSLFLESSFSALVAVPLTIIAFLPRILIEETTLKKDLAGYADYMTRVRWRMIPFIF
jgi:protein-S-isoprenylcysteine O-methyltransferase Ste14